MLFRAFGHRCHLAALIAVLSLSARAQSATFQLLGTHPDAAAQGSADGKVLTTLEALNGKMYVGYGDYGANTGPINIRAWDPATESFTPSRLTSLTESIWTYRLLNGKLYAPNNDTSAGGGSNSGYAVGTISGSTETFSDNLPVNGIHMFDMNSMGGGDLWMVGSQGINGVAWHSTDGGANWSPSLTLTPMTDGWFTRIYSIGLYDGKLYVQGKDHFGNTFADHPTSKIWDGTSWSDGPTLMPFNLPRTWNFEEFAGEMIYLTRHSGVFPSRMLKFDGTSAEYAYDPVIGDATFYDYAIAGDTLIGLLSNGQLLRTTDLVTWTAFDTAPLGSRSLGLLDDMLYIGTANSQLYRYSQPVPEPSIASVLLIAALIARRRNPQRSW